MNSLRKIVYKISGTSGVAKIRIQVCNCNQHDRQRIDENTTPDIMPRNLRSVHCTGNDAEGLSVFNTKVELQRSKYALIAALLCEKRSAPLASNLRPLRLAPHSSYNPSLTLLLTITPTPFFPCHYK